MNKIIDICRSAHRRTCPFYHNDKICRTINEDKECDMKCSYMRDFNNLILTLEKEKDVFRKDDCEH